MITVEKALDQVQQNTHELSTEYVMRSHLLGRTLGEDILAPIDLPSFDQSAMDGYAFNLDENCSTYKLLETILQAGSAENPIVNKGECVRIFTGGRVPDTANCVVQQELVSADGNKITITAQVDQGKNIRLCGEQIKKGEVALKKGTKITAAGIGFLAGLGVKGANVFLLPTIGLITTGNELVKPDQSLKSGQIYESNSYMLKAALETAQFNVANEMTLKDDYVATVGGIKKILDYSDVVLITGGISVGDYDYVKKALLELGVAEIFYKVSQKPGKPLFFGKKNKKVVFALPGNPAAALTCFYVYVLPALNQMTGNNFVGLSQSTAKITTDFTPKGTRALFLKGKKVGEEVQILKSQSSAMLDTFAIANCLIYLPQPIQPICKGDLVTVYNL